MNGEQKLPSERTKAVWPEAFSRPRSSGYVDIISSPDNGYAISCELGEGKAWQAAAEIAAQASATTPPEPNPDPSQGLQITESMAKKIAEFEDGMHVSAGAVAPPRPLCRKCGQAMTSGDGSLWCIPCDNPPESLDCADFTEDLLRHMVRNSSQYDSTCRRLAANLLEALSEIASLKRAQNETQ